MLSILGKLYDCKSKFELETTSLNFISNARFSFKLSDGTNTLSKDEICIIELSDSDKKEIIKNLKEEHKLSTDPIFENITFLKVVDLSLNDSPGHTKGKISDFLNQHYPDNKYNIPTVYRMLFDEVKRRSNYTQDILQYEDLINHKGIGKNQFEDFIKTTGISKNYDQLWIRIDLELQNNGLSFQKRKALQQNWKKLEIERMDSANDYLFSTIKKIIAIIRVEEEKSNFDSLTLLKCVENVYDKFVGLNLGLGYSEEFIKSIILSELYE